MSKYNEPVTPGEQLESDLLSALKTYASAPLPRSRELFVITDLKPSGGFKVSQENTLIRVSDELARSKRVFRFGENIVFESRSAAEKRSLRNLAEGCSVARGAEHLLANLIVCKADEGEFAIPRSFVELLLRSETLERALPTIIHYAHRPVFDEHFVLRGPGWHSEAGILVHGPHIESVPWPSAPSGQPALKRLPPQLQTLLADFCFKSDADMANYLGLLLTGVLVNRYVRSGKPLALFDGNQPGVGKSLLAQILGVIVDGSESPLLPYTAVEEELRKTIGARLRETRGSVIAIDNAKVTDGGKVESPTLESLSSSPQLAIRILGKSEEYHRPNDLIWAITMNDTRASDDLIRRSLPIRLEYEGDPGSRKLAGDPLRYAEQHRVEILGELIGMVDRWIAAGQSPGTRSHRFKKWAEEVGGILLACGFPEFLTNITEAAEQFSSEGGELATLAEYVIRKPGPGHCSSEADAQGLNASKWVSFFEKAGVCEEQLHKSTTPRSKVVKVGNFLTRHVGQKRTVRDGDRLVTATLQALSGRSRDKSYYFLTERESVTGEEDGRLGGRPPSTFNEGTMPSEIPDDMLPMGHQPVCVTHIGNCERW